MGGLDMWKQGLVGRKIECCGCHRATVKGAARVMRKVLFFFCLECWADREKCEEWMRRVAL
jgi:hypothetical protein